MVPRSPAHDCRPWAYFDFRARSVSDGFCPVADAPGSDSQPLSTAAAEGLAFLAAHLFLVVTDTLALVGFGGLGGTDLGGVLTDLLLVSTADDNQCSRIGRLQ